MASRFIADGKYTDPGWMHEDRYQALLGADVSAFAWEWLRRTTDYREAYARARGQKRATGRDSLRYGLERFEDPSVSTPDARPVWTHGLLFDALTAHVTDITAAASDRVDLRLLSPLVTIVIDDNEVEHLLLSDGRHFLRIDIVAGTLIGCPAGLTYLLRGLTRLRGPMISLARLSRLVQLGRFDQHTSVNVNRDRKWILELRTADALALGCDQQTIARALFAPLVPPRRWRSDGAPIRRRVQRLVQRAHDRLQSPTEGWFR